MVQKGLASQHGRCPPPKKDSAKDADSLSITDLKVASCYDPPFAAKPSERRNEGAQHRALNRT